MRIVATSFNIKYNNGEANDPTHVFVEYTSYMENGRDYMTGGLTVTVDEFDEGITEGVTEFVKNVIVEKVQKEHEEEQQED